MKKDLLIISDDHKIDAAIDKTVKSLSDIINTDIIFENEKIGNLLDEQKYKLIILDTAQNNIFKILSIIKGKNYFGSLIVLLDSIKSNFHPQVLGFNSIFFIEKPFEKHWFKSTIVEIYNEEKEKSSKKFNLHRVIKSSMIQWKHGGWGLFWPDDLLILLDLIHAAKKSLVIWTHLDNRKISLVFDKGEIVHAVYKDISGVKVLSHLVTNPPFSLMVKETDHKINKTIRLSFADLLRKVVDENRLQKHLESKQSNNKKEKKVMDIKKITETLEKFQVALGGGLMACDLYTNQDNQSIASINGNPQACAMFGQVTKYLVLSLSKAKFPKLRDYYMINLEGNLNIFVALIGEEYQFGCLVDTEKAKVGYVVNVALPEILEELNNIVAG